MNYKKIRDVKNPNKAHTTDAGIDFFIPNDFNSVYLLPTESILIPSGIIVEIPTGYMGMFADKSGIATKYSITIGAKIIDSDYRGEVHIDLHNIGNKKIILEPGMKIAQMIIIPIWDGQPKQVDDISIDTERSSGGFGSTGEK